ncbi:MAG TPA: hypothetical protein VMW52_00785, partial [Phycisphaerae bacterium]|nr:hypothetical protein [Phycisphaerae bacterium]
MRKVRHSTAFSALTDEQFASYQAHCLDRKNTLAGLTKWAKEAAGLKLSPSMVARDRAWFMSAEERIARTRLRAQLAQALAKQLGSDEQVAALQGRAVDLFTQVAFDALGSVEDVDLDSMPKLAALGAALASVQRSALSAYRAEVDRRTKTAAEEVK